MPGEKKEKKPGKMREKRERNERGAEEKRKHPAAFPAKKKPEKTEKPRRKCRVNIDRCFIT